MNGDQTTRLQALLDRIRAGDESGREELVRGSYERLHRLARKILHRDFPRLQHLEDTGDVLHASLLRLIHALKKAQPQTVRDYFRLSARLIRNTLIDSIRYFAHRPAAQGLAGEGDSSQKERRDEPPVTTDDPLKLAQWAEFHRQVEQLPEQEQEVIDLLFYQELSQREAAEVLGINQTAVHRIWVDVRLKLAGAAS